MPSRKIDRFSRPSYPPTWAMALTDSFIIFGVVFSVQATWPVAPYLALNGVLLVGDVLPIYTWVSLSICLLWLIAIFQTGSLNIRNLGSGTREYNLVARATLFTFIIVTLASYLFKAEIARGYLLFSLPIGLASLLIGRWLWRKFIVFKRVKGNFMMPVVIVGSEESASEVAIRLKEHPEVGFQAVGVFLSKRTPYFSSKKSLDIGGADLPIFGGFDEVVTSVRQSGIHHIIISNSNEISAEEVRKLSWQLLPGDENLYLAANILDVSGPRLQIRPVAGMPLIEVMEPELKGLNRILKRTIDLILGIIILILTLPLFAIAAAQIKLFDRKNIFFLQTRVGKNGKLFKIIKFRTMRVNAESELEKLDPKNHENSGNGVLFKLKDDPRVTKPGKWLRRSSIDELPQIFNVIGGSMSLVGPRPPLPTEADDYEAHVHTRFLVKPGITGLWQVSGRSDLSWEESVRADLTYVQNWSIIADLVILWRTVKVVVNGTGAY